MLEVIEPLAIAVVMIFGLPALFLRASRRRTSDDLGWRYSPDRHTHAQR